MRVPPSTAQQAAKVQFSNISQFKENPKVAATLKEMEKQTKKDEAGYVIFLPEVGQGYKVAAFEYGSGFSKEMNLDALPAGQATIRGTICINVSGHNGQKDARDWAKTNTYSVRIVLPNGKEFEKNGIARSKPNGEEWATAIPVEFPAMKGTTTIEAWADGSAGVAGYVEGRQYLVHSSDDPKKYVFSRPQHPSQRDDTADNPT